MLPRMRAMPGMTLVFEKGPLIALSVIAGALAWIAEEHVGAVQNTISIPSMSAGQCRPVLRALYHEDDLARRSCRLYPHLGMPPLWQSLASAALLIAVTGSSCVSADRLPSCW